MHLTRKEIFTLFCEESQQNLERMEDSLVKMHSSGICVERTAEIFRYIHTLKGSSANFKCTAMAEFAHMVEELLAVFRERPETFLPEYLSLLFQVVDALRQQLESVDFNHLETQSPPPAALVQGISHLLATVNGGAIDESLEPWLLDIMPVDGLMLEQLPQITSLLRQCMALGDTRVNCDGSLLSSPDFDPARLFLRWNIELDARITAAQIQKIESRFDRVCTFSFRRRPRVLTDEIQASLQQQSDEWVPAKVTSSGADMLRVPVGTIDTLSSDICELLSQQGELENLMELQEPQSGAFQKLRYKLDAWRRCAEDLQSSVMGLRMVKIEECFSRFYRLCAQLSLAQNKKVQLKTRGGDTEIDKLIFEPMVESILHLLRNAIDHGVQTPHERVESNKPEIATITIAASQRGGQVQVDVSDDGKGIDYTKLRVRMMQVTGRQAPFEPTIDQLNQFMFEAGVSTRTDASDVSGRGVGTDVVKENIERLDGQVMVESSSAGTKFSLQVPLTLALLAGQMVRYEGQRYVIPISFILETAKFESGKLSQVAPERFLYHFRGGSVPVIPLLGNYVDLSEIERSGNGYREYVVIVQVATVLAAIIVDSICGHQQFAMKNIDDHFKVVPGFSGGSILGNGQVVLVVDVTYQSRHIQKATYVAKG